MIYPTTYLSPEECKMGEGLRILSDPHFYWPPTPEPLPHTELEEIEAALAQRAKQLREQQEEQ